MDQYIELYNNSDQTISTENIHIALLETESTPWFADEKEQYIYAKDVFRLPTRDLGPGESILIARQAINHTIDAPLSLDLTVADYEVKAINKPQNSLVEQLPHVYKAYPTIDWLNMVVGGGNQLVLFRYEGDVNDLEKKQKPDAKPSQPWYLQIATSTILDGVECLKYNAKEVDLSKRGCQRELTLHTRLYPLQRGERVKVSRERWQEWKKMDALFCRIPIILWKISCVHPTLGL